MRTRKIFNRYLCSLAILLMPVLFTNTLHAQPQERRDKIESMHAAYITEHINLTLEQAKRFWPVYDQYHASLDELQKQRRQNGQAIKNAGGIDNMSDADVQKLIANEIDIKTRELDLRKEYVVKFQEVITLKQVAKLFIAEEQFKLYLLDQLKKRRQGQGRDSEFVPQ